MKAEDIDINILKLCLINKNVKIINVCIIFNTIYFQTPESLKINGYSGVNIDKYKEKLIELKFSQREEKLKRILE